MCFFFALINEGSHCKACPVEGGAWNFEDRINKVALYLSLQISEAYEQLSASLSTFPDNLRLFPPLWSSLIKIKVSYFTCEAFCAASRALLALTSAPSPREAGVITTVDLLGAMRKDSGQLRWRRPRTFDEVRRLARAKMAEAVSCVDDARRTAGACKEVVTHTPGVLRFLESVHTK